jgi:aspartyl-tRNA(Asn)/glutamyl-tRNA(Gln) amidotransferase subunit B
LVDDVIAANPDQVAQYLAADEAKQKKLSGFFVGQIMKASQGRANPKLLNELLIKKLNDQS